jgi:hypothetical protein
VTAYTYTVVCDCTGVSEVRGWIADNRDVLDRAGNPRFTGGHRITVTPRPFAAATEARKPKDLVDNTIRCHHCLKNAQLSGDSATVVCDGLRDSALLAELPMAGESFHPDTRRELPLALLCLILSRITR